ncbi:MAG: hypothetical protein OXE05_04780 [Chloroflexi bacterium]|nr:hypothetical protein [Chloroflexota bacterium]
MKTQAEIMTYAEMESAFDGEWVLIGEPELTSMNEVIRGVVLGHDEDRVAVYEVLWRLREEGRAPSEIAVHYFGAFPNDVEFLI